MTTQKQVPATAKSLKQLIAFAKLTAKGGLPEGTDLLSALVNLVDTARENPGMFDREENDRGEHVGSRMMQADREAAVVSFILNHCQENL